jgi:hypothetical protein
MTDLDQKARELRALAKKATQGEWYAPTLDDNPSAVKSDLGDKHTYVGDFMSLTDRDYAVAANPATLTAILDEYDRRGAALVEAEGALDEAREFINRYSDVHDGDYGSVEPNEAMKLVHVIDQAYLLSQEVGK